MVRKISVIIFGIILAIGGGVCGVLSSTVYRRGYETYLIESMKEGQRIMSMSYLMKYGSYLTVIIGIFIIVIGFRYKGNSLEENDDQTIINVEEQEQKFQEI